MKTLFILAWLVAGISANSQTTAEWTSQKKTQIKYLLQQIAANKVYIEYLGKGYNVARKGLNTIQDIKNGDFNLHRDFIHSLGKVNPKVKSYVKVADIISYQLRIVKAITSTINGLKESNQFTNDELDYTKTVFDRLLEESIKDLNDLYLIITSGELNMKDDERIIRIDQLFLEMQDKYSFCKSFSDECSILAMQRLTEKGETRLSRKINGLE